MNPKDPSNFRQFIIDAPNQFKTGFEIAKNIEIRGKFSNITISGMGGSALPANLLRTYCNDLYAANKEFKPIGIYINRYYSLPPEAYENCLNIVSSYSGTTEETISSFEEAYKNKLACVGISSGGTIEEMCKKYNIPHVKLPIPYPNYQPRMGTGYFFGSMLQILINQGLVPDTSAAVKQASENFNLQVQKWEELGKVLAKKLVGKTPIIFSTPKYKSVAMIWKIKINENAKTPSYWNFFPEADHNEMVGYTNPQGKFIILMLKDLDDNVRNQKRYEATARLLTENGVECEILDMEGDSAFYKMFSSVYLADWTSYYLALAYNQDPTPVEMVEKLKKILAS